MAIWTNDTKNTATWTDDVKNTPTWTNDQLSRGALKVGTPIGLLLALTYSFAGPNTTWTNDTKN